IFTITDPADRWSSTVRIGGPERLTVGRPADVFVTVTGELVVTDAERVEFGWHYYGRLQTDQNWCDLVYQRREGQVEFDVTGPIRDRHPPALPEIFSHDAVAFVRLKPREVAERGDDPFTALPWECVRGIRLSSRWGQVGRVGRRPVSSLSDREGRTTFSWVKSGEGYVNGVRPDEIMVPDAIGGNKRRSGDRSSE
ncbi:MAG: hypothetical protein C4321_10435, partial [Chloroflexota bacterium]